MQSRVVPRYPREKKESSNKFTSSVEYKHRIDSIKEGNRERRRETRGHLHNVDLKCKRSASWWCITYYLVEIVLENEGGADDDLSFIFDIEFTIFLNFEAKASCCFSEFCGGEYGGVTVMRFLFF